MNSMNKGSYSVKNGRILPFNSPMPLIPDNNLYAKYEKFHEQILKLSIRNGADGRTDGQIYGRTDRRLDGRKVYHNTRQILVAGYKNAIKEHHFQV